MGDSLYWLEDGLLIWDKRWDLESKDYVARLHGGLRSGCIDDLDYACKLFALYEQKISGLSGGHPRDWARRYFVNINNFDLVNEARAAIIEPFVRGRKTPALRPLDFSLIPRVRLLMAVAWPDRGVSLDSDISSDIVQLTFVDSGIKGIVSRNSCASQKRPKKNIVAIMDRSYAFIEGKLQECPVANFLINAPGLIPPRDAAEIAPIISAIRADYDERKVYAQLLADQYAPVGTRVRVESSRKSVQMTQILNSPDPFNPVMADVPDEEGEESFTGYDLYD
jgi:hypothetical protein